MISDLSSKLSQVIGQIPKNVLRMVMGMTGGLLLQIFLG